MNLHPDSYWQKLVKEAIERYNNLSDEDKKKHDDAQKEIFLRGMRRTGDPRLD